MACRARLGTVPSVILGLRTTRGPFRRAFAWNSGLPVGHSPRTVYGYCGSISTCWRKQSPKPRSRFLLALVVRLPTTLSRLPSNRRPLLRAEFRGPCLATLRPAELAERDRSRVL